MEKYLERLRFEQGTKQRNLGFPRDRRLANARFEAMSHPITDPRVLNVLKLSSDRTGIDAIEQRDHFAQRHLPIIEKKFR